MKPRRTWLWNQLRESCRLCQRESSPLQCSAQRSSCDWNRSFFLHLHPGICKELSQEVCFPSWIMTSNNCSHSLPQELKSEERLKTLWQIIITVNHVKAPTCYHTTENRGVAKHMNYKAVLQACPGLNSHCSDIYKVVSVTRTGNAFICK